MTGDAKQPAVFSLSIASTVDNATADVPSESTGVNLEDIDRRELPNEGDGMDAHDNRNRKHTGQDVLGVWE